AADKNPGTLIASSLGIGYNDRLYAWEPRREWSFGASIGAAETVLDTGRLLSQGTAAGGGGAVLPLADGHQLALDLGGAITFGDLKIARQMLSAGGAGGLRGYDVESMLGLWRAVARVEWRHLYSHELNFNLLHSLYLRGIAGAVF